MGAAGHRQHRVGSAPPPLTHDTSVYAHTHILLVTAVVSGRSVYRYWEQLLTTTVPWIHTLGVLVCLHGVRRQLTTFLCCRYLLAKTSVDGQTRHAAIFLSNQDQTLLFQYLPRGLSSGFRTVSVSNINLSTNGSFHHLAVVVYRDYLSVFVDGAIVHRGQLTAEVEDSSEGVTLVGKRAEGTSRFQGKDRAPNWTECGASVE